MLVSGPDGTECVMLDAGYGAIKNYKMIRDAGRKPVICTRKNYVARNVHLVGTNFSSAAPRSRGGSVRLRSRQAGGDPGAGARMSGMATAAGAVSARMSNMKRIPAHGGCLRLDPQLKIESFPSNPYRDMS